MWSADGISAIENGEKSALSSGYRYRADFTPGRFGGQYYDGVMRGLVGNHVAIVSEPRIGDVGYIGDSRRQIADAYEILGWRQFAEQRSQANV